jgi:chemotaxis regulatin CheY-phosphate phosphatase CheZ
LSTAEDALRANESRSEEIEQQVSQLKERWNKFCVQVAETKHFIELSIQYYSLIEEVSVKILQTQS